MISIDTDHTTRVLQDLVRINSVNPRLDGSAPGEREIAEYVGAAMAASGAVALYHIAGVTPEADAPGVLAPALPTLVVSDLAPAYAALDAGPREVDLVWFGCPHASVDELSEILRLLHGRTVKAALWVTTAREVREQALQQGYVAQTARLLEGWAKASAEGPMVEAMVKAQYPAGGAREDRGSHHRHRLPLLHRHERLPGRYP